MRFHGTVLLTALIVCLVWLKFADLDNTAATGFNDSINIPRRNLLTEKTTIRAARSGRRFINLSDGKTVAQSFEGEESLIPVLNENAAMPLSLATADFDEDGMPDLVAGFATSNGGILTFSRGNVDALYPNSPEAVQRRRDAEMSGRGEDHRAAFLPETKVFGAPEAADFLGAGDFDADGHWDLILAERGKSALLWLAGDGRGNFAAARRIELKGAVTALTTGEINRADGLTDVVVATDESKILVFENPAGAFGGEPEILNLPAPAVSLSLGQLDDEYTLDLAVAAGNNLILVSGRDRKLSHPESVRNSVPAPQIERLNFPFEIEAIAVGDFIGQERYQTEIALLAQNGVRFLGRGRANNWKESGMVKLPETNAPSNVTRRFAVSRAANAQTETLLANASDNQIHVIGQSSKSIGDGQPTTDYELITLTAESRPVAVLPMRLNADALSDLVILTAGEKAPSVALTESTAAGVVTNTNDSGAGSLRAAMATGGLITFNIPGAPPFVINLSSPLPVISNAPMSTGPITIDGTTQPGYNGSPVVFINDQSQSFSGLDIRAGNSVVRGLGLTRFANFDINLSEGGNNIIEGCFLGIAPDGNTGAGNTGSGVQISNSSNNRIGGTTAAARNVAAGNGNQILIRDVAVSTNNLIQGNYIGINAAGTTSVAGGSNGVVINYTGNTVGGTTAGGRNILSGGTSGVSVLNNSSDLVQGNYIGTDFTGLNRIAGTQNGGGVFVSNSANFGHTIGGTTPAARNVIAGNYTPSQNIGSAGINLSGTGNGLVQGNYIGVSADGITPIPNIRGIWILGGTANTMIGGTNANASNVIAYGIFGGVVLGGSSDSGSSTVGNSILGNSIYSNGSNFGAGAGLGIDLIPVNAPLGVTPNDLNDADTGVNNLQNFPVLTSAASVAGSTTITGSLNSNAGRQYRIEFFSNPTCDSSGNGEGKTYLGFANVATNSNGGGGGDATINVTLPVAVSAGRFITATATVQNTTPPLPPDTSEFSPCLQVTTGSRAYRVTDFSGDGTSDLALFRPPGGFWFIRNTASGAIASQQWGTTGDIPQPADYDGDGRTDLAVFRPGGGNWFILQSSTNTLRAVNWGLGADKPVAADFDGDNRADIAVYRPSSGTWFVFNSSNNSFRSASWGVAEDKPAPTDFDGDGRADVAVFRPSNGVWYIVNSNDNSFRFVQWGVAEDKPVAGDFDADGRADIAVWRPSSGVWYVLQSTNNSLRAAQWGTMGDVPQPGDFDGDNRQDFIVWRSSSTSWYILRSSDATFAVSVFGAVGDSPVSSPYRIE